MKNLFVHEMFWMMLIVLLYILVFHDYVGIGTWDLNRTIGWGWDFMTFFLWYINVVKISIVLFILGYGVINIYNRNTHFALSLFHVLLIFTFLWLPFYNLKINFSIGILAWLVFVANVIYSFKFRANQ